MSAFRPSDILPLNAPVTNASTTFLLPREEDYADVWGPGKCYRMVVSPTGGDLYFKTGSADVTVTQVNGIMVPAGAIETFDFMDDTHIALICPSGAGAVQVLAGVGE